jgi:hypothetical protein
MNNRSVIIWSLVLGSLVVVLCLWFWNKRAVEREFSALFLPGGNSHIAAITISGQQRSVKVTDAETLTLLEGALRNPSSSGLMRLGMTYGAAIKFSSGHEFNTFIYVHADKGGISIANPVVTHAGDPEITALRFAQPLNAKLRALMDSLAK